MARTFLKAFSGDYYGKVRRFAEKKGWSADYLLDHPKVLQKAVKNKMTPAQYDKARKRK